MDAVLATRSAVRIGFKSRELQRSRSFLVQTSSDQLHSEDASLLKSG